MVAHVGKQSSALRNKKEKTMSYLTTKKSRHHLAMNEWSEKGLVKHQQDLPGLDNYVI